jgi:multidrug efflux pump subunit AcrA (membrane-fusion protein)
MAGGVRPPRPLAVVAVALVLAAGLLWWRLAAPGGGRGAGKRRDGSRDRYATGSVEPVRWAKVTSLVRNRIIEICYCEGKIVAKGDVLARLDDKEPRAALDEFRAREEFAKREMERVTQLLGRGAATIQTHEKLGMDLRQVQALISVQMKAAYYTITAPMAGVAAGTEKSARSPKLGRSCSGRRPEAAADRGRGQRRGHSARARGTGGAVPHRAFPIRASRQLARDHPDGRHRH